MLTKLITVAAAITGALAQRPTNTSICDYYTTALLKNNTAANQKTLLTLVVNTAVIGNYTQPNVGIKVAGILAPGTYNGTAVNLLPYFNGALASTNRGGSMGVSRNFLDDGGAAPLMMNMAANGTTSNQYMLLTHLYEYFGALLGCSMMGNNDFPAYTGSDSMYQTHKFMDLSNAEVGYFITQVAMSAASFGVAASDLQIVGTALSTTFGMRCAPPAVVIPTQAAQLQAICIAPDCPIAANATCDSYAAAIKPSNATSTGSSTGAATGTAASKTSASASKTSGTTVATASTAAAPILEWSFAAVAGGIFAALL